MKLSFASNALKVNLVETLHDNNAYLFGVNSSALASSIGVSLHSILVETSFPFKNALPDVI